MDDIRDISAADATPNDSKRCKSVWVITDEVQDVKFMKVGGKQILKLRRKRKKRGVVILIVKQC